MPGVALWLVQVDRVERTPVEGVGHVVAVVVTWEEDQDHHVRVHRTSVVPVVGHLLVGAVPIHTAVHAHDGPTDGLAQQISGQIDEGLALADLIGHRIRVPQEQQATFAETAARHFGSPLTG